MSKIFALLAILLIATGIVLMAVPKTAPSADTRSIGPESIAAPALVNQARELAEQVNAPLSIVFGLVSLFYSRRSYQVNKARADAVIKGR
jgi:hypothetical protein